MFGGKPSHAAVAALLLLSGCGPAAAPSPAAPAPPVAVEFAAKVTLAPQMFSVLIPAGADRAGVERAARDACTGENICSVLGWTNRDYLPRGFPMTDREVEAQAFSYRINRNSGLDEFLWLESSGASPAA